MADARISELPVGSSPLSETDEFVIRRGSNNLRVSRLELQKALLQNNSVSELYLKGDETTDGSIRFVVDVTGDNGEIQLRTTGVWAPTGLVISAETLFIGKDTSLSAIGSELKVESIQESTKRLLLEVEFDDLGTRFPRTAVLGPLLIREVFIPFDDTELVTNSFELSGPAPETGYRYKYYNKMGSVAATSPVTMKLFRGTGTGGPLLFQKVIPASEWPANTEVEIEIPGTIRITKDIPVTVTYTSDNDFSLLGTFFDSVFFPFFAFDIQLLNYEPIISTPTGTDKYLFSRTGSVLSDRNGNVILAKY